MGEMAENSVDSIVTDPPYGLSFMGKNWDRGVPGVPFWEQALRVLKPGGHLLAFGGSRTYHRLACAIEDAGFEIRDQIMWIYGSGFPKSLDIGKAIDKAAGVEREVVGSKRSGIGRHGRDDFGVFHESISETEKQTDITAPATDAAKQWDGFGTAIKPAHEPIVLARKPFKRTVAANVLEHGTGGLNIDGCRVGAIDKQYKDKCASVVGLQSDRNGACYGDWKGKRTDSFSALGRFPANVIHDGSDEAVAGMARAAKYFYCPKASKSERNAGLEALEKKTAGECTDRKDGSAGLSSPRTGAGRTSGSRNIHPTVKPIALMAYLCRLVTPPGGVVLDPFMGSGSTGVAALSEGFAFHGIEISEEYLDIACHRIAHVLEERA
jgi:site-specific DNA-methyltransferase (adenine-specific)